MKTIWPLLLVLALAPAAAPRPTGTLKLHVLGPSDQSLPRELAVRVRPTLLLKGNEDRLWELVVSCPVRDEVCVCEVPAGQVDLRFQGTAMMPVYKWGVFVPRGEMEDLGRLELHRGAAISGWVRTREEQVLTHSVLVSLAPQSVGSGMVGLDPKPLRTLTLEANSRPWGFFKFEDVLPGRYVVLASEPGLPSARFGPIVIEGGRSVELPEPVWITPPRRLEVQVSPARGPDGKPWLLKLLSDSNVWTPGEPFNLQDGRRLGDDRWAFENLPVGNYSVLVQDSEHRGTWKREKVRLGPEPGLMSLTLKALFVAVKGRVAGRPEPSATSLELSSEGAAVSFRIDEQGRFSGHLPDTGAWKVRLWRLEGSPQWVVLQEPVRAPTGRRSIDLLIRIPDTRLRVEVVDESGRGLPRAWLNVYGKRHDSDPTDEHGRIEIIGLSPGPQCLLAAHADPPRHGEETPLVLQEGQEGKDMPPVRLVVPDGIDIRGRIRPRLGFAAGAQVLGWPSGPNGRVTGFSTVTDEDGDFRLPVSAATRMLNLLVLAPGSALRMLRTEVSRERLLEIPVDTPGGTLVLDLGDQTPENAGPLDGAGKKTTTHCDPNSKPEALTLLQVLRHWADLQGAPQAPGLLVVPNVEPGPYTLCAVGSAASLSRHAPPEGDPRCVGGVLEVGGELRLRLPVEQKQGLQGQQGLQGRKEAQVFHP